MSSSIPHISFYNILDSDYIYNKLYKDTLNTYYWSDDFSPDFYAQLARLGFISTSTNYEDVGDILLPEIQEAYAVLFFENLHISRKVKKLIKGEEYKLTTGKDLDTILPLLNGYHKDSWLTDSYVDLVYKLEEYTLKEDNFELMTTLLKYNGSIIAGELGYNIGTTYTSLTGFCNKEYKSSGTIQLVLLSKYLQSNGFAFWNLGHPYMEYKKKLGAKILSRKEFLSLWLNEIN